MLDVVWIHGSPDCATNADPSFQVHRFDRDTYILRQNKCSSFEAPFLYLLFGQEKALLLDTGDQTQPGERPIREIVDEIIEQWSAETAQTLGELIVAHSHSHGDHAAGDLQFAGRPATTVVRPQLDRVQQFFGLSQWPNGTATLNLGDRELTVLPLPGHEPSHIAIYDSQAQWLLTGDSLYPGLLTIRNWAAYRQSLARLADFASERSIAYVLGAHIEMKKFPGQFYDLGTTFQPDEHVLELKAEHINELRSALDAIGGTPSRRVLDDFVIFPIP